MNNGEKTSAVLLALTLVFLVLAISFGLNLWGRPPKLAEIPIVDPKFTAPTTIRQSYAELVRTKADLSDFDCYACHDKKKPPTLHFDTNQVIIVPSEHSTVVMGHGRHNRNNNCFNCHDEHNLELLQTRDGHQVTFAESTRLCGSCHGPTYRDWEAGAHGRTSAFWTKAAGQPTRQICVDCHNPHHPKIPPREPAPAPNPLRPLAQAPTQKAH